MRGVMVILLALMLTGQAWAAIDTWQFKDEAQEQASYTFCRISAAIIAFESAMLLFWHLGQRSWEVISRKACSWASSLNCQVSMAPSGRSPPNCAALNARTTASPTQTR